MKILKPILCCFLTVMMLLPLLVGCVKEKQPPVDSDSDVVSDSGSESNSESKTEKPLEYDENGYLKDDLGTMDFEGREIRITTWSEKNNGIDFGKDPEQIGENVLYKALYDRNVEVERRLNVKLLFQTVEGSRNDHTVYLQEAEVRQMNGEVDIFGSHSWNQATLMSRGYTMDVLQVENLDLSKPWWSKALTEKATINDHLYFVSGDISASLMYYTYIMTYNKRMAVDYFPDALEDLGYKSVYEMVDNKKWTFDNLLRLCKGANYEDGDGEITINDSIGFSIPDSGFWDGMYWGAGLTFLSHNDDGSVKISEDMYSAKAGAFIARLNDMVYNRNGEDFAPLGMFFNLTDMVTNDRILFVTMYSVMAADYTNEGVELGVLPYPMYDEYQQQYHSVHAEQASYWSISRKASAASDVMGAVLECLASEGYRKTTPALFETTFKVQTSESPEDYEMWNLVRDSVTYDPGRIYHTMFDGQILDLYYRSLSSDTAYGTLFQEIEESVQAKVTNLNYLMTTIESSYGD